jgi:hypothetical protein
MSTVLVPVTATLAVTSGVALPAGNAAQASISVVVTDGAGTVYPAVVLFGTESPPYTYGTTFASGAATAVATALDTNGATIGTPASYSFTVTAIGVPTTYTAPAGFSVVATEPTPAVKSIQGVHSK